MVVVGEVCGEVEAEVVEVEVDEVKYVPPMSLSQTPFLPDTHTSQSLVSTLNKTLALLKSSPWVMSSHLKHE